ncbi:MAG: hypothetical protein ACYDB3_08330 [Acidimicrobiales bacterium]
MRISWTHASRRHGIARKDAQFVIEHCGLVFVARPPSGSLATDDRLIYLGDDESGRALEVIGVAMEPDAPGDQHLRVLHVMELRRKYKAQYEEAKKWRV